MTILVTGGAGYIGSHMLLALKDKSEDVVVIDRLSNGSRKAIPQGVELIVGDIADPAVVSNVMATHNIEAIVHFAGSISVPESVANPLLYYNNNTANSLQLIELAVRHNIKKFIFSSTAAVYGNVETVPITEAAPAVPTSPYGASKHMTEQMLTHVSQANDLEFVALRYFNVAGADPHGRCGRRVPGAQDLITVVCDTVMGTRPCLEVFGDDYPTPDGTCIRDFIHVSDLVNAHMCALDYLRNDGVSLIANCGYSSGISIRQVIEATEAVTGDRLNVKFSSRRAGDIVTSIADASLLRQQLGWQPQYNDLQTIIASSLSWRQQLEVPSLEMPTPASTLEQLVQ